MGEVRVRQIGDRFDGKRWHTKPQSVALVESNAWVMVRNAFRAVVETRERDEEQGYRSSLRTYILDMAKPHRAALNSTSPKGGEA